MHNIGINPKEMISLESAIYHSPIFPNNVFEKMCLYTNKIVATVDTARRLPAMAPVKAAEDTSLNVEVTVQPAKAASPVANDSRNCASSVQEVGRQDGVSIEVSTPEQSLVVV
eukprot:162645_1